eukprot:Protomagalhaensia_sp_Gyna_25__6016@NODE_944_length_2370_cov_61_728014_g750_i0_p2_GENE_NODE_944_length_2370_cov_61_728014_g750_i0NODE_944_length_2370_cov_61_728014_g750_i0_p2_ORF_typecomplete_len359_score34_53PAP2/PF01569_21/2_6e02PAP2/PF01569_21/3_7e25PAP2_3/PF14378_6/2_1e06FUSC/PF04632_12/0_012DUF2456/PF10445_9/6_6e02DUF2456/PF10445_9/0_32DUF2407_C/PF13373_6/0_34DUF4013/PF13197_6/7_1DUF4013/PF13197_6/7_1DUF2207/PF09972_9/1e02DUF2207/PF09972_9/1_9OST3_OST6/PF04756_13/1_6OST3_OST6/PF04756_13/1_3e
MKHFQRAFRPIYYVNEIIVRLVILGVGLYFQFGYGVFIRDVQAKDWPSYAYPYTKKQMFSEGVATLLLVLLTLVSLIIGFSTLRCYGKWSAQLILDECCLFLFGITLSASSNFMMCSMIKKMYGRLRPDYLSRCYGSNNISHWMAANGFNSWDDVPEVPACNSKAGSFNLSAHEMEDARMSFPSSHSSLSFAIVGFLALWTYSKMCLFKDWGAWRLAIPAGLMLLCSAIAVSRTSDYRHHASDVLFGILLGLVICVISFLFYFPLNMTPLASQLYSAHQEANPSIKLMSCHCASFRWKPPMRTLTADTAGEKTRDPSLLLDHDDSKRDHEQV